MTNLIILLCVSATVMNISFEINQSFFGFCETHFESKQVNIILNQCIGYECLKSAAKNLVPFNYPISKSSTWYPDLTTNEPVTFKI